MAVFHPSARSLCEQRLDNCECDQNDSMAHIACRQFEPTRQLALAAEWTYKVPGVGEWWRGGPARSRQATACRPGNACHADIQCVLQAIRLLAAMSLNSRRWRSIS